MKKVISKSVKTNQGKSFVKLIDKSNEKHISSNSRKPMRSPPLRFAPFRALVLDYYITPLRSTCEPKLVSQNLDSKLERKKLSQNLRFKT